MLRLLFGLFLISFLAAPAVRAGESVALQLKWRHAYQFAGYYMAKELGYYRDAGLNVEIREGGPGIDFVGEVVSGRAQYGIGSSGLVLDHAQGRPVVALAAIFQHSPDVLLTAASSGLVSPQQLVDKLVMTDYSTPAIAAMLRNEAGSLAKFRILEQTDDLEGLMSGRVDALAAYITDQPFFFLSHRFAVNLIRPIQYGVDFYGDTLFTSEKELDDHGERVKRFRQASLKGWKYAMENPDVTIAVIKRYGSARTIEHLWFEFRAMSDLVLSQFIELGHMNPGRWQHIADTYVKLGLLKPHYDLAGFIYDADSSISLARFRRFLFLAFAAIAVAGGVIALLLRFNRQLQAEVRERQRAEERLNTAQSIAQIGSWEGDLTTGRAIWSDQEFRLLGYQPYSREPGRAAFLAAVHPDDRPRVAEAIKVACDPANGQYRVDFRVRAGDDGWRILDERGRVEFDADGKPLRIVGTTRDITDQRQAEAAIRESAELLRTLGRNLPGGAVFQLNTAPDGSRTLNFITDSIENLLGIATAEVMADVMVLYGRLSDEDRQRAIELEERAAETLSIFELEAPMRHTDGHWIWISVRSSPRRKPDGAILWDGVMMDISSRVAAEAALAAERAHLELQVEARTAELRQRERDLKTILDNVPAMVGYWDRDLRNRFANQAYGGWFDLDPADLPGKHLSELLGPEMFARDQPQLEAVFRGEPQVFERRFPRAGGQGFRYGQVHYLPDAHEDSIRGFYVMVFNITALRQAEAEIVAAEERYRTALESARMGTWSCDLRQARLSFDARAREHFGAAADILAQADFRALIHPEDWPALEQVFRESQAAADRGSFRLEIRRREPNGGIRYLELSGQARFQEADAERRPSGLGGTSRDVTDRKLAEEALTRSETLLRTISENLPEGAIYQVQGTAEGERRFNFISDGVEKLTGVTPAEAMADPSTLYLGIHPDDRQRVVEAERRAIATGEIYAVEARVVHRDGSVRWLGFRASLRYQADGTIVSDGVMLDVSQRKQVERELREAKDVAEAAAKAKADFLANISHEIRTPMNAILGMAYLLENRPLGESEQQLVRKIRVAGGSLMGIINDVLDFSKIDAGRLELERVPFRVSDVLERVEAIMAASAGDKPLRVEVGAVPEGADLVLGDPLRLEQILINLAGNAIKFTERGAVTLAVVRADAPEGRIGLRFAVRDTGIGIAPEHRRHIFSAFSQADSSTTRRFGGTGLGLGISHRLVGLMDGEMGMESELGVGSEFWFEIPFEAVPDGCVSEAALPPPVVVERGGGPLARLAGLRVLVVDDNEINREVARCVLEEDEALVETVEDGLAALDYLRRHPVDAVLMDVQMPVMDGYEATREIRRTPGLEGLPVIALTAGAFDTHREAALAAGMNDFIAKPFDTENMIAVLRRLTGRETGGQTDRVPLAGAG